MNFNKVMQQYYQHKLNKINEIPPMVLPLESQFQQKPSILLNTFSDVFGWLVLTGMILHFFFIDRYLSVFQFLPGVSIIF